MFWLLFFKKSNGTRRAIKTITPSELKDSDGVFFSDSVLFYNFTFFNICGII